MAAPTQDRVKMSCHLADRTTAKVVDALPLLFNNGNVQWDALNTASDPITLV